MSADIANAQSSTASQSWYCIKTKNGSENSVVEKIKEQVVANGFGDLFGDFLVPVEKVVEVKNDKKREIDKLLYPGYVFLQMSEPRGSEDGDWHEAWRMVRSVRGSSGFLGASPDKPTVISDSEIQDMRARMQQTQEGAPRMTTTYTIGQDVRIVAGPFADFDGIIDAVDEQRAKVTVNVTIFGRVTPVVLSFDEIKRV